MTKLAFGYISESFLSVSSPQIPFLFSKILILTAVGFFKRPIYKTFHQQHSLPIQSRKPVSPSLELKKEGEITLMFDTNYFRTKNKNDIKIVGYLNGAVT
jgi:hypothetical protein